MGSMKRATKLSPKKPNATTRRAMKDAEEGRTIKGLPKGLNMPGASVDDGKPGDAIIEVTITRKYVIPQGLNGWTNEQVVYDWFYSRGGINSSHATRDANKVGGSDLITSIKKVGVV